VRTGSEPLGPEIWAVNRPLPIKPIGDIRSRMTVIRSRGRELMLHSPVELDADLLPTLDSLGEVRWLIGPNKAHHLFLADYRDAFPNAMLCGAPGLPEKRTDLQFAHVLAPPAVPPGWPEEIAIELVEGIPWMNEVAFLHRPSRTLVLTDLVFNVERGLDNSARVFHFLVGATDRFGPHRLIRFAIRDRRAARRSLDRILAWDFDAVVMSHGAIVRSGGHAMIERAFAFLR
jgi:uncharacterized protein DUF4336